MFKAIRRIDRGSIRTLAETFIETGNYPAALLCLDHVFSSPLKLRNLPLAEIQASLSLYLDYIRLLNRFRRDESLARGSNHQMLFGFQVLGENRYLVPRHTVVHEELTARPGLGRENVDGYTCDSDELRRCITQIIKSRTQDRTEIQNGACTDVHGFSPCLYWLVEKRCSRLEGKGQCPLQHMQPEQLTVGWYRARLRLILLQIKILDLACYYDLHVVGYVMAHSARSVYEYSLT